MFLHQQTINVPFAYPVWCGHGIWDVANPVLGELLAERPIRRIQVVCETAVASAFPELENKIRAKLLSLRALCEPVAEPFLTFPGGEHCKNIDFSLVLCRRFEQSGLCRHSAVVAIGGGAFLDAVGFATALNHRGLRLIRMPTTTLSQCDSGVGVKNGVDAFGKKNFLGVFAPPHAVLNDFDVLATLPYSEWVAGIPEAVKVAVIKDREFFEWLMAHQAPLVARDMSTMAHLIRHSAQCHLDHIAQGGDPFEMGSARPLDFGHWAAHKLESMSNYRIGHGAAVAIGLLIDAAIAVGRGHLDANVLTQIRRFFEGLGIDCNAPELHRRLPDGTLEIFLGLEEFREHLGGELQITLPNGVGQLLQTNVITPAEVEAAIKK